MSVFIATSGQSPNEDRLQLSQNVAADLAAELTSLIWANYESDSNFIYIVAFPALHLVIAANESMMLSAAQRLWASAFCLQYDHCIHLQPLATKHVYEGYTLHATRRDDVGSCCNPETCGTHRLRTADVTIENQLTKAISLVPPSHDMDLSWLTHTLQASQCHASKKVALVQLWFSWDWWNQPRIRIKSAMLCFQQVSRSSSLDISWAIVTCGASHGPGCWCHHDGIKVEASAHCICCFIFRTSEPTFMTNSVLLDCKCCKHDH